MSNNPFSKYVVDPSKVLDPNTITARQFQNYAANDIRRMQSSMKVYRKSAVYIAGCAALMLVAGYFSAKNTRREVLGFDNQGGVYLNLQTPYDEAHYAYNRQFQRMCVLKEGTVPDRSTTSSQLLTDLGVDIPKLGRNKILKKPPHEKYY